MAETVTLIPRRDFLFRGKRYRVASGPVQLEGTLEDRSIQALLKKGLATEPGAEGASTVSVSVDAERLETVASRLSAVVSLQREDGEHPLDYLERLTNQALDQTADLSGNEEEQLPGTGTSAVPELTPPTLPTGTTPPAPDQTPVDNQAEGRNEGLSGEAFAQRLRIAVPDDAVATLLQNGITSEKVLGEKSDAELKALPNLGDARVAKLREAFSGK